MTEETLDHDAFARILQTAYHEVRQGTPRGIPEVEERLREQVGTPWRHVDLRHHPRLGVRYCEGTGPLIADNARAGSTVSVGLSITTTDSPPPEERMTVTGMH